MENYPGLPRENGGEMSEGPEKLYRILDSFLICVSCSNMINEYHSLLIYIIGFSFSI